MRRRPRDVETRKRGGRQRPAHKEAGNRRSQSAASRPELQPKLACRHARLRGHEAEQPGERNPKSNARVDHPGEIGAPSPRQVLQRPRAGRDERPGAEHAGDEAQNHPRSQSIERAHGGRGHDDAGKAHAHQRRQGEAQPARGQGADQIAQVVAGRQPRAGARRQRAVTDHQRQERREGEPADPHRHRQSDGRNGAGSRDGERGQTCVDVEIGSHAAE